MKVLSKQDILAADDLVKQKVNVKEWGGTVTVSTMTGSARDDFEAALIKGKDKDEAIKNLRSRLLSLTLVDEAGERLFSEKDIEALGKKSAKVLDRLYTIAARLNAVGAAEEEELAKNFGGGEEGSSTSASPVN